MVKNKNFQLRIFGKCSLFQVYNNQKPREYVLLQVNVNDEETLLQVQLMYLMVGRRLILDESSACFREVPF